MYLRAIDSLEAVPIPGTENGTDPFFSPDGQWLGFFTSGELKKVSLSGGAAVTLASIGRGEANWTSQGRILLEAGSGFGPLRQVSELGGNPQPLFSLEKGEAENIEPVLLPGGKEVAFISLFSIIMLGAAPAAEGSPFAPWPAASVATFFLHRGYSCACDFSLLVTSCMCRMET